MYNYYRARVIAIYLQFFSYYSTTLLLVRIWQSMNITVSNSRPLLLWMVINFTQSAYYVSYLIFSAISSSPFYIRNVLNQSPIVPAYSSASSSWESSQYVWNSFSKFLDIWKGVPLSYNYIAMARSVLLRRANMVIPLFTQVYKSADDYLTNCSDCYFTPAQIKFSVVLDTYPTIVGAHL